MENKALCKDTCIWSKNMKPFLVLISIRFRTVVILVEIGRGTNL